MNASIPEQVRRQQIAQLASQLPQEVRAFIGQAALDSQKVILPFPYYSTTRLNAALSGAGPFSYTIAAGERKCFNYKIGDSGVTGAGFPSATVMTQAETNLLKPSETRDNADVVIWGISAEIMPTSDAFFAQQVFRNAYVKIQVSGTQQHLLGRLSFFPQGGGLFGGSRSTVTTPPLAAVLDDPLPAMTNGMPTAGNYFRLPYPLKWNGSASGGTDTSLIMSVTLDNAIALAGVADRAGAAGVAAFTHPADGSVFVDICFRLVSVSVSPRGSNA